MSEPRKTTRLGSVFTDTAALLIGDPCQVIPDCDRPPLDWEAYIAKCGDFTEKVVQLSDGDLSVQVGCDGWYPVYLETDDDGQPSRLVIELGGRMTP